MGPHHKNSVVNKARRERDDNWGGHQHHAVQRQIDNPLFNRYYRELQKITGNEDVAAPAAFDEFLAMMRSPLPTTVWINDTDELAPQISSFFESFAASEQGATLVTPIPWYPIKGMGWRIMADKTTLRKDPAVQQLRQFLIRQTAMGTISRQEEVSMIPTFLLDMQPCDRCLDMCASPGSKTAQMLVQLGRMKRAPPSSAGDAPNGSSAPPFPFDYLSEGLVMANELDYKRANMLVHQVKRMRLLFPFALFTNHDARFFPEIEDPERSAAGGAPFRFDKILCDVVCSGDGTLRKAPHMFKSWTPREALKLQRTQVQIALRAAHLLKVGGRMVYSTCSLNPIENEAVVAQLVKRTGAALRLVDARALLPELASDPGLSTWVVTDAKGNVVDAPSPDANEALFPLDAAPYEGFDLRHCMRLLPHHCNGGGFFVAVLDKVSEFALLRREGPAGGDGEAAEREAGKSSAAANDASATEPPKPAKVAPRFVPAPAPIVDAVHNFYEVPDFPVSNLVCRVAMNEENLQVCANTTAVMVSRSVLEVLQRKSSKLIVVSAGLRTLVREPLAGGWRVASEAAPLFSRFMTRNAAQRVLHLTLTDIKTMIGNGRLKDVQIEEIEDAELRAKVESLAVGAVLAIVEAPNAPDGKIATMAMRARSRLQLLVDAEDLVALQLRLNISLDSPLPSAEGVCVCVTGAGTEAVADDE